MSAVTTNADLGISVLSFDGGGAGTYSQLLLLKEYMSRVAINLGVNEDDLCPADHFDMMGGVGFGGLVALMLGHLRMSTNRAIDALLCVASAVFPNDLNRSTSLETNMQNLRAALENLLKSQNVSINTTMYEKASPIVKCKVALYAANSADICQVRVFRTYPHRGANLNPTIIQALCATIAIPSLFSPVRIGSHRREETFVGGPLGANNPTQELLKEAGVLFGNGRRVAQIVSLGAGRVDIPSVPSAPAEVTSLLMKSLWTETEKVAEELSTRLLHTDTYTRLNVDIGLEEARINDWNGLKNIEDATWMYVHAPVTICLLKESSQCLQNKVGLITLGQINNATNAKVSIKTAPLVSPYYITRQKPWRSIVHHLVELPSNMQKIFAITGMGGCGKTQLVSYFLQEYGIRYVHTAFLDASSSSSLKADLQAWAQSLGPGHEQDVWEDALRFLTSKPFEGQWIIILDNADDPDLDLSLFIPKCYHGTVIITSRNRDAGALSNCHHLELGEMEMDEAISTLLLAAQRNQPLELEESKSAHELIGMLGYLAVALVQAGTFCRQWPTSNQNNGQMLTFRQYIALFSSQRVTLMKRAESCSLDNYQLGAYAAFDLSYNVIPQLAKEFLHFISTFHYSSIPLSMFATAAQNNFADPYPLLPRAEGHGRIVSSLRLLLCADGKWNEAQVHQVLRTLRAFSLVSASSIANIVFIHLHPLVHAWARDTFPAFGDYRNMGIQTLTSSTIENDIRIYRYLLPHLHEFLRGEMAHNMHINDQMVAGIVLQNRINNSNQAEILFTRVIGVLLQKRGGGCYEAILVAGWLSLVYDAQGKLVKAESLKSAILEKQRHFLGEDHLETIQTASNLATTLDHQGRWREAEQIKWKVLEQRTRILGRAHPKTIDAMDDIGETFALYQRWQEREIVAKEVLELRTQVLGSADVKTIGSAVDLAVTYSMLGKAVQAETLGKEALKQCVSVLGVDHSRTMLAQTHLAKALAFQGRWKEAEAMELEVFHTSSKLLGKEHRDSLHLAANLARYLSEQGKWAEAEKLEMEVLELRTKTFGKEHPDTILVAGNLARTLAEQGRIDEAEKLEFEVLEQRRRILPKDHPHTIRAAANLASTYMLQGRLVEAESLKLEALEQRRRLLGSDHIDTIRTIADLAIIFRLQGRLKEAMEIGIQALNAHKKVIGIRHPYTIAVEANLALTYKLQNKLDEAESLLSHAVDVSIEVLGTEHPYTQTRVHDLISILQILQNGEKVAQLHGLLYNAVELDKTVP